jgi:hypothetical protein
MTLNTYQISLNFEQILELVKQLPQADKLRLSKELEKSTCDRKLTELLATFQTNELDLETINQEVEIVRAELYDRQKTN